MPGTVAEGELNGLNHPSTSAPAFSGSNIWTGKRGRLADALQGLGPGRLSG